MRTFAIVAQPFGTFAVTANPDGSVGINARVVAERDKLDREGNGLRALVEQANAARELEEAALPLLRVLRLRMMHLDADIGEPMRALEAAAGRRA